MEPVGGTAIDMSAIKGSCFAGSASGIINRYLKKIKQSFHVLSNNHYTRLDKIQHKLTKTVIFVLIIETQHKSHYKVKQDSFQMTYSKFKQNK